MSDNDEITPQWGKQVAPPVGIYIWPLRVVEVSPKDSGTDKPYLLTKVQILADGQFLGFEFDFRLYYSIKAEKWCKYFLKKFNYPKEYLDTVSPILKQSSIKGLSGKARVHVTFDQAGDQEYVNYDMKGFEHLNETELEEKLAKERASQETTIQFGASAPAAPPSSPLAEIDVNADVKEAQDLEALAELDALDAKYIDGVDDPLDVGF